MSDLMSRIAHELSVGHGPTRNVLEEAKGRIEALEQENARLRAVLEHLSDNVDERAEEVKG